MGIGNIRLRDTGAKLNARDSTTPIYRQALLYSAFSATMLVLIIGILSLLWLWQVKDLGVSVDWTGRILTVQPDSLAAQSGVLPGDSVSFNDFERIKRTSGQAHAGQTLQVEIWHGSQPRTVTLEATPLALPRRLSLCIEAIIGLGFVLLGATPLFARRRTSSLWLFFASSLLVGMFLIADGPRALRLNWAEVVTYITLPLFPAVLFHFHTVFPKPTLGRYRRSLVIAVYVLAVVLLPFNLASLNDYSFYLSDGWQVVLDLYIATVLLACMAMMLHTFFSTRDPKIRSQLKIVTLGSAVGLSINAILILPHVLLDLEANDALKNLSVMSALTVPFGYSYSIWRHNLLIDGLLWRRWLVRVVSSSVLLLAWLAGVLILLGSGLTTSGAILSTWWSVVLSAVLVVVVNEKLGELLERLLFKGSSYVELLASTTNALQRSRD